MAVAVEARRDPVHVERTVHVVLDVFLSGPYHLDRSINVLRYASRKNAAVSLEPPPETSADEVIVDLDGLTRQTRQLGYQFLRECRCLGSNPDVATILADMYRAVHRLHGRMRQKRSVIDGIEALMGTRQRTLHISIVACHDSGLL